MARIGIIIGSTREGRATNRLADWVHAAATKLDTGHDFELVDLLDYPLPFISEASPRFNPERKAEPAVQKWLDIAASFDSYIVVTPEYNRSVAGVLKNALDLLDYQIEQKAVAIVAHGSNGGAQAVDALRSILPQIGAVVVPSNVYFGARPLDAISETGELSAELAANPWGPAGALEKTLTQLVWLTERLQDREASAVNPG